METQAGESSVHPTRTTFVGRAAEIGELRAGLAATLAGGGGFFLIAGEPGIGKTRLAREVAADAAAAGARALEGRCWEGGGAPPYWPWAQAFRGDPENRPLLPELHALLAELPAPERLDSDAARFQLFSAVAESLRSASGSQPLLVFLDDLQWADESSLLLLEFLARTLEGDRVLLLGAYRDVGSKLDARIEERITALLCHARSLSLRGLDVREVGVLVERASGRVTAESVVRAVNQSTGGNPLFVEELVRLLRAEGRLGGAGLGSARGLRLPERVRAVIQRRVDLLSAECRRVLAIAAVLGHGFDLGPLTEVAAASGDRAREALDEARAAGLVAEASSGFLFVHDLFREAQLDGLPEAERRRLHTAVGAALERLYGGAVELHLSELAHHFSSGSSAEAMDKAIDYSARAGDRAARQFAYADAAAHYQRALQAFETSGAADPARRCRLLLALGENHWSTGEFGRAREIYGQAAELAGALGLPRELGRAALGFGGHDVAFDAGAVDERLVALLERALAALGDGDAALRAALNGRLATALAFSDRQRAAALAGRAVELARSSGDRPTLYFVLNCHHHATWTPENLAERLGTAREIESLAKEIGAGTVAEVHVACVVDLLESGDRAGVDEKIAQFERRSGVAERRTSSWIVCVRRAMLALLEGRFAEAEGLIFEALRLGQEGQNRNAEQIFGIQMLALRSVQGRLPELVGALEQRAADFPAVPAWGAALPWVLAEVGREEDARRQLDRVAGARFADLPRDMFWLAALWLLTEAVALLRDGPRAEMLLSLLAPYQGRFMTATFGYCGGSLDRSLGLLAATAGRFEVAAGHFEAAIAANARMRARPWVARSEHDYARMLLARGEPGDRERAAELLRRALATARSLGLTRLAERTEPLLADAAASRETALAFVGRARELAALSAALDEVLAGEGRLFLVTGEPGIGKTRLIDEFSAVAEARGAEIRRGRGWEAGGAPAYWPWVQVLRAVVRAREPDQLRLEIGASGAYLAELAPELREKLPDLKPLPVAQVSASGRDRFQLFDSVTAFLRNLARRRPLVLVLDDLHAADEASLLLLEFLARELRDARILAIGAFRPTDLKTRAKIAEIVGQLIREAATLPLVGLDETEVACLVRETAGVSPAANLLSTLHRATRGNPFFVAEVARLLSADGRWHEPGASGTGSLGIPDGVREAIHRRLAVLGDDERRTLSVAAVIGSDFDLAPLGKASGLDRESLLAALARPLALGIVVKASGRYGFSHGLVRETLYDEIDSTRRAELHARIGKGLEEVHGGDLEEHLAELAHHFLAAAGHGDRERAVDYSARAGRRALALLAYGEAAAHFENALAALDASSSADEPRRCELLVSLCEAQRKTGRVEDAVATCRRATDLARKLGTAEHFARAVLGIGGGWIQDQTVAKLVIELLEEALDALATDASALRVTVLARLAEQYSLFGSPERRAALAQQAVEMARRVGDPVTLGYALAVNQGASWGSMSAGDRLGAAEEIARLGAEVASPELDLHGREWRIHALMDLGETARADREITALATTADATHHPGFRWLASVLRAMRVMMDGRFEEAERLALEAHEFGQPRRFGLATEVLGSQFFTSHWLQGRLGELEPSARAGAEQHATVVVYPASLALVHSETGALAEARDELERVARDDFAAIPQDETWPIVVAYLSLVAANLGDAASARSLYRLLAPLGGTNLGVIAPMGPVAHYLGLLAGTMGRWDEATRHFDDALALSERMRARPFVALTQHAHGRMLLARGGLQDRLRALEFLDRAIEIARELGMKGVLDGAERLRRGASPAGEREAMLRREGEYWTVAYGGLSARVRDARGLRLISQLLRSAGREFRVTDLIAPEMPPRGPIPGEVVAKDLGLRISRRSDDGPDERARTEYRARLEQLREEIAEAERGNDRIRAARAREEVDAIAHQIATTHRRQDRDLERTRLAVTKAIRYAIRKIEKCLPELGRMLDTTIRTGTSCRYEPDARQPIRWVL